MLVELKAGENEIVLKNPVRTLADSSYTQYTRMARELKKATAAVAAETGNEEKPIIFSICEWGTSLPWHWGAKAGNMWRTTHDIMPFWKSVYLIYRRNIGLYKYAKPGAWNDPDMLEVGNGKLTPDENRAHFSLWCMMAAPLVLGNDLRTFVNEDGTAISDHPVLKIVTVTLPCASSTQAAKQRASHSISVTLLKTIILNLVQHIHPILFTNCGVTKNSLQAQFQPLCRSMALRFTESVNNEI